MMPDLKEARIKSGCSQKQISTMINISERTLSRYESEPGKAPIDVAVRLLSIYNVPLGDAFKRKKPL